VKQKIMFLIFFLVSMLFSGCNLQTVDKLYCLPKRSEEYTNLQTAMDKTMVGLEFSAPISGEFQQSVQMADMNGDGISEYIVFAKGTSEQPLKILIFSNHNNQIQLMDTISCSGTAFEQVKYTRMDDKPGYELVVGCQLAVGVLRSVSVYSVQNETVVQLMSANYSKFLCNDLDEDGLGELFVLRPGVDDAAFGYAECFEYRRGSIERSPEVRLSSSVDSIKRVRIGNLQDGPVAVFVASAVGSDSLVTDIFSLTSNQLVNLCETNERDERINTLREYFVYGVDIDRDGFLELPSIVKQGNYDTDSGGNVPSGSQHIIRWYSVSSNGEVTNKMYTYHNFLGGWYLQIDSDSAQLLSVTQQGNSYIFTVPDVQQEKRLVMTLYALTGQKREEQALVDNRFVIYRTDSTVYAVKLEVSAGDYGISKDKMANAFHMIQNDWYTATI